MAVACMTSCNPLFNAARVNSETAHHWNAEEFPEDVKCYSDMWMYHLCSAFQSLGVELVFHRAYAPDEDPVAFADSVISWLKSPPQPQFCRPEYAILPGYRLLSANAYAILLVCR